MPVRRLPENPSLDHLRHQAKDLLKSHSECDPAAAQTLREFHPRFPDASDAAIFSAPLKLTDAQLTIAREAGFPSWTRLKRHIEQPTLANRLDLPHHERIEDPTFRRAVDLIDTGDAAALRLHLTRNPKLIHQRVLFEGGNYFRQPTLLEFIAENPIRHGKLPPNLLEIAQVLLDAEPERSSRNDTLLLVATGSVVHNAGMQLPLIDLLCSRGADPNSAIEAAAVHGELAAVQRLIERGARIDLPIATALDHQDDFNRLLPAAGPADRHLALALAAQLGRLEILQSLLNAGEDPNRYNPVRGHSHGTPLHHAAGFGHLDIVHLLVERGARTDLKDVLWHATPAEWAEHEGRTAVAEFLRSRTTNV